MRVTLLHNPSAGDERHSAETICALITDAGHEVDYVRLDGNGNWKRSLDAPPDLFAIAGGDGAVGEALIELAGRDVPAAVLPVGSANNIATSLGLSDAELEDLVAGWSSGRRHSYRPGSVSFGTRRLSFAETVGGGLFADAIERGQELEDAEEDKVRLGLEVLRDLLRDRPLQSWTLELDGDVVEAELLGAEAMVIGWTGPGVPLAPRAAPCGELLHVVLVSERERSLLVSYVRGRLEGRERPLELPVRTARDVILRPAPEAALRIDDDLLDDARGELHATRAVGGVELLLPE